MQLGYRALDDGERGPVIYSADPPLSVKKAHQTFGTYLADALRFLVGLLSA